MKTLKAIRDQAPSSDRNDRALIPTKPPEWATGKNGAYVHISLYPRTLDELGQMSRSFGAAAVAEAQWTAITLWFMKEYPSPSGLRNPLPVADEAVCLIREHDRLHLGWPRHHGGDPATPVFDGLSLASRQEAMLVATETLADWEAAGSPYLHGHHIKAAYQYLVACPAFRSKYVAAPSASPSHSQDNQ
ncbi:MAG TPA: hypothetical protein VF463_07765 [Sphingobium sp.]